MLAVRSQKKLPEDPQQHLVDFFGNYRDPMWDNMDEMRDENEKLEESLPEMEERIVELEKLIELEKRRTAVNAVYRAGDPDETVSFYYLSIS